MRCYRRDRTALTLIELLVVLIIIGIIAGLAAAFVPRVQDRQYVSRGVDLLSQWLLTAKQRARRDQMITGIQLYTPPGSGALTQFSQIIYVQQPPPLVGAPDPSVPPVLCTAATNTSATFNTANYFNNAGSGAADDWLAQQGDFFCLFPSQPSPVVHFIQAVGPNSLTLASGAPITTPPAPTSDWTIYRMPRRITGEPILQMPSTVVVDFNPPPPATTSRSSLPNPQQLLFYPNGSVVNTGMAAGKIVFWVHDPTSPDPALGGFVAVQIQTGFISSYDIDTSTAATAPWTFVDSGNDSGF